MRDHNELVLNAIQNNFTTDCSIISKDPVGGGCINQTSILTLSNNKKFFLKENFNADKDLFKAEFNGLKSLGKSRGPRVPIPYHYENTESGQFILMEYIESRREAKNFWENFGRNLALLHKTNTDDCFGYHINNHIGQTPQINNTHKNWLDFFADNRLLFQTQLAQKKNLLNNNFYKKINYLISNISKYLIEPEKPSLLHGDLWSGNFISDEKGEAVIIDPAVYYGHPEADIAMTQLFGGFNYKFYKAYEDEFPLQPGFSERKDFYNLYHMLNHLNMFGTSYLSSVISIINKYT